MLKAKMHDITEIINLLHFELNLPKRIFLKLGDVWQEHLPF